MQCFCASVRAQKTEAARGLQDDDSAGVQKLKAKKGDGVREYCQGVTSSHLDDLMMSYLDDIK